MGGMLSLWLSVHWVGLWETCEFQDGCGVLSFSERVYPLWLAFMLHRGYMTCSANLGSFACSYEALLPASEISMGCVGIATLDGLLHRLACWECRQKGSRPVQRQRK